MLISTISTVAQAILIYYAYSQLTQIRINLLKLIIYLSVYTIFALLFYEAENFVNTAYLFAITVFLMAFFHQIKLSSSLVAGVVIYTAIFIVSLIVFTMIAIFTLDVEVVSVTHKVLASLAVFAVFSSKMFRRSFNFKQVQRTSKAVIPMLGILWVIGFGYIMLYNSDAFSGVWALATIITLCVLGVIAMTIFRAEKRESDYINIRKKEHDFGNILNTIGALAASKPENLAEKIEEYVGAGNAAKMIKTGDSIVDIIVENKLEKAKLLGIEAEFVSDTNINTGNKAQDVVRVLGILLDNAIEAEPEKIKLCLEMREELLRIKVWDNGKRIRNAKKVFNMGYSTKSGEGRGVGLANVKELAESAEVKQDINGKEFCVCIKLPKNS